MQFAPGNSLCRHLEGVRDFLISMQGKLHSREPDWEILISMPCTQQSVAAMCAAKSDSESFKIQNEFFDKPTSFLYAKQEELAGRSKTNGLRSSTVCDSG